MSIQKFGALLLPRVEEMESKYALTLPAWYKNFLLSTNGGIIENARLRIPDLDCSVFCEILYGLDLEDSFNIDYWMSEYGDELPPNSLIVGDDTLKGFLILFCKPGEESLVYWDDVNSFPQSNERGNAYIVFKNPEDIKQWFEDLND